MIMAANPNYKKLRLPQLKKVQSPSEVQNKIKIFTDVVNSENPSPMLAKGMVMDWEKPVSYTHLTLPTSYAV